MKAIATGLNAMSSPVETEVFDTYWYFAAERQSIFFRRLENNCPEDWTMDPILRKFKFTNAYRVLDRATQFLIRNVIYRGEQTPQEIFFRTLLFKLFNRIETWEVLERELGHISYAEYSFKNYDRVLNAAREMGKKIYSAAYILPSGSSSFGYKFKHRNNLKLLEMMMDDEVSLRLTDLPSMKQGFELMRSYPTIGDFLAYQYITDLNYSEFLDFSENEFVIPGPGAVNGIRKCFSSLGDFTLSDLIRKVADCQETEFNKRGIDFQTLWGRPLQLIDCQNLFCEVDKYARVKHPDVIGNSKRTRIKQNYNYNSKSIQYWFPPKWQINKKAHSTKITCA